MNEYYVAYVWPHFTVSLIVPQFASDERTAATQMHSCHGSA